MCGGGGSARSHTMDFHATFSDPAADVASIIAVYRSMDANEFRRLCVSLVKDDAKCIELLRRVKAVHPYHQCPYDRSFEVFSEYLRGQSLRTSFSMAYAILKNHRVDTARKLAFVIDNGARTDAVDIMLWTKHPQREVRDLLVVRSADVAVFLQCLPPRVQCRVLCSMNR